MSNSPADWVGRSREYLGEVQIEFKKVTWPTQKETIAGTVGVLFIVAIIGVALFFVDWGLGWVMNSVLP